MKHWLLAQSHGFWLASAQAFANAKQHDATLQGSALFKGKAFKDVMLHSPYFCAVEDVQNLDEQILAQGAVLICTATSQDALTHLRSLLIAGLHGEEVLFRFYDPVVMQPMIHKMSTHDANALLGPVDSWSYWHNAQWQHTVRTEAYQGNTPLTPWWVIDPQLIAPQQSIQLLTHNLSRHLWQKTPQLMTSFNEPEQTVFELLKQAQTRYDNDSDALIHALTHMIAQTDLDAMALFDSMGFDEQSAPQLSTFQEGKV